MKQTSPLPKGSTLSKFISDRIDSLSKSQREVAQYIVDHMEEVAFQTAEELARRVSTSSSTVVRFSQNLGFDGFPELQHAARDEYRRNTRNESSNGKGSSKTRFNFDQTEFEAALMTDHVNVEETAGKVSAEELEATSKAIVKAGRVMVIALDQMAFFGGYLRYLMGLLDIHVDVVSSPSQDALAKLSRIDSRTLVIGLVAGRPDPLLVRALKLARHRKGVAVAVTDASLSKASKYANISFYFSSNSPSFVRSHTALISFIQALAYCVYTQDTEAFDDRIKAVKLK